METSDVKIVVTPEVDEPLSDGGNAKRLIRLHGDDIRYCHSHKKWMVWDSHRWKIDCDGEIFRLGQDVVKDLYLEASTLTHSRERDDTAKFATRTDSPGALRELMTLASIDRRVAITADKLDSDIWIFNTATVAIDLKTCLPREPSREDLITKMAGTAYDPTSTCPKWETFLHEIFDGDIELIQYVQRAVGYTLTGSMQEQVYFFLYGLGANGKSVFLGVLNSLMGEYAKQASFTTFQVQRSDKVRNDLAALAGARLVTAQEAEEGAKLSMQVVKQWTGGDPITARFLFGEDFTFRPVGKIWLAANTKPIITERNYAAWRRVNLIPFEVTIPKERQDRQLEAKLLEELPGILNWALDGLREYHRIGLNPPRAVQAATEEYRIENDSLGAFIADKCRRGPAAICKNTVIYEAYRKYCKDMGYEPLSTRTFPKAMAEIAGIKKTSKQNAVFWKGIALSESSEPEAPMQPLQCMRCGQDLEPIKAVFTDRNTVVCKHCDRHPAKSIFDDPELGIIEIPAYRRLVEPAAVS